MSNIATQPSVTAVSMVALTGFLEDKRVDSGPILANARMHRGEIGKADVYYSLPQTAAAFLGALEATHDPHLGLHVAESMLPPDKHPFLLAARHAPDLRTSLKMLAKHLDRTTLKRSSFKEMPDVGIFEWEVDCNEAGRCTLTDYLAGRFLKLIQRAPGQTWRPAHVRLVRAVPSDRDEYLRIFGPNVEFASHGFNRVIIDRTALGMAMPSADATLFTGLADYCGRYLKSSRTLSNPEADIRAYLQRSFQRNAAGLTAAAGHFGVSEDDLRRCLDARGTTFAELSDATRQELAEGYLNETQMPLSEVAARLGFAQQSAFTRAARRWFGMSPSTYRRRSGAGGTTRPV